jgi:hypothetical protein
VRDPKPTWYVVLTLLTRLVRLALACALLGLWGALLLARHAQARSERFLFGMGEHFTRYAASPNQTTPVELQINGASVYLSNGTAEADVKTVLDHFHDKCVRRNGQLRAQWAEAGTRKGKPPAGSALLDGVFRAERDDAGVVACLETGEERLAPSELLARVQAFLATGDAATVGHLRYVHVSKSPHDPARAFFIAIWSEDRLPLFDMFPVEGDAPGRDPSMIERPSGARRLLSAEQVGREELVSPYASASMNAEQLVVFYRQMLARRGYTLLTKEASRSPLIVAQDGAHMITVAIASDGEGRAIASVATRTDRGAATRVAHLN